MSDLISRQAAIDALGEKPLAWTEGEYELGLQNQWQSDVDALNDLPSAQPEIIRCKDCKWGAQDEVGRWFCRSLGCQIGNEDGSGFCADAERRADNANANA